MRKIIYIIFILLFYISASYASDGYKLRKIDDSTFNKLESSVKTLVGADNDNELYFFFYKEHSFELLKQDQVIYRLVPISYVSVKVKNSIGILFVFNKTNEFVKKINLHYIQRDADEISEFCSSIASVSLIHKNDTDYLVYLMVVEWGNQYGNRVYIGSLKSNQIINEPKLMDSMNAMDRKYIDDMPKVRKVLMKIIK